MPRKAGFRIERPPVDRSRLGKSDTAPSLMTSVPFLFSRGRTMKQRVAFVEKGDKGDKGDEQIYGGVI